MGKQSRGNSINDYGSVFPYWCILKVLWRNNYWDLTNQGVHMHKLNENLIDVLIPAMNTEERHKMISALMLEMNAFISIDLAEKMTTLDKSTQYRERKEGNFPQLVSITSQGRRKAYRLRDLKQWLERQNYAE